MQQVDKSCMVEFSVPVMPFDSLFSMTIAAYAKADNTASSSPIRSMPLRIPCQLIRIAPTSADVSARTVFAVIRSEKKIAEHAITMTGPQ